MHVLARFHDKITIKWTDSNQISTFIIFNTIAALLMGLMWKMFERFFRIIWSAEWDLVKWWNMFQFDMRIEINIRYFDCLNFLPSHYMQLVATDFLLHIENIFEIWIQGKWLTFKWRFPYEDCCCCHLCLAFFSGFLKPCNLRAFTLMTIINVFILTLSWWYFLFHKSINYQPYKRHVFNMAFSRIFLYLSIQNVERK